MAVKKEFEKLLRSIDDIDEEKWKKIVNYEAVRLGVLCELRH